MAWLSGTVAKSDEDEFARIVGEMASLLDECDHEVLAKSIRDDPESSKKAKCLVTFLEELLKT